MTAKEYLRQIRILETKYQTKREEVDDLRELATSTGAIRYDKDNVISSPSDDQMINAIIRITEAENRAMKVAVELAEKKEAIIAQLMELDDEVAMRVLCLYYVRHKKLETIADIMHFSYDWTKHLHINALKLFEDTYPEIRNIA